MNRRSLLKGAAGAVATAIGAAIAAPVLALVGAPLRRRTEAQPLLPVADLGKLPEGKPVRADVVAPTLRDAWTRFDDVALGAVWLVREGQSCRALSTVCPHAGCFVDWEAEKKSFGCPCHGSRFDLDGKRLEGPSPRAMDALETEVKDGKVLVKYQRFRQATSDKEPV